MIITEEIINRGMSVNGAWSLAQLAALGINPRKNKGWKKRLIGKDVPEKDVERFLSFRDRHLKQRSKYNDLDHFLPRLKNLIDDLSHTVSEGYDAVQSEPLLEWIEAYEQTRPKGTQK